MFDKDKFKESLTEQDIIKVLNYYESDWYYGRQGEIVSQTVCHNRSNGSHKLYYYPDTHTFHCYTGCGSFDIFDLAIKVNKTRGKELNFSQAINEIARILGISLHFGNRKKGLIRETKTIKDWDWLNKVQPKDPLKAELKHHDNSILKYFNDIYPSSWYDEGISIESMEKYEIKFYPEMYQTIIPHRDQDGNLIGIRSRNWRKEYVDRAKYIPTYIGEKGYNHPLGYALYGLYQNKETIKRKKKAMIVEGEKSCLFADTMYQNDNFVVAICGSSMSKYQSELLLNLGIEEVIIAMDKEYEDICDYEGNYTKDYKEYMMKINKIAKMFAPYCRVYHLTDTHGLLKLKESPLDIEKEKLELLMEQDKHLITLKDLESGD